MQEIWKPIPGYISHYQISNTGQIRSLDRSVSCGTGIRIYKGKILKPWSDNNGYLRISLSKNGKVKLFLVHRLVAIAFIENPNCYEFINHIDGNPANPKQQNLEWCDRSHNMKHAFANGMIPNHPRGSIHVRAKLHEGDIPIIRNRIASGESFNSIARSYNIASSAISCISKNLTWKHVI